jgi:hypothetical protein
MGAHREYSLEDRIILAEHGLTSASTEPEALLRLGEIVDIIEDDLYEDCLEHTPEADRVRALQHEITRHWRTNAMRETTERRLLEETPEERHFEDGGDLVVFTTNRLTRDRTLRCVVEAHRIDTNGSSGRRIRPVVVMRASRRVWRAMSVHRVEWSPYAARHVVGPAVDCPGEEALETALALWDPGDTGSPYHEIEDAVAAATRICSRGS